MFFVNLAGRLGKDPETRFTPSGQEVTTFSVATNHRKGKEEITVWVRVTVWGDRFKKLISFLKKGSAVIVAGRMTPPAKHTDKEGQTQFNLEVTAEMLEFSPFGKADREEGHEPQGSNFGARYAASSASQNHATAQHNASPSFYGAQTTGQGVGLNASIDEEALPF